MMKKKLLLLVLVFVMAVTTACGNTGNKETDKQGQEQQEQAIAYPITVTDQLGREVVIEEKPETIVSGYYISTSLLIALGQKDKLVGVEAKAGSRPIYSLSAPEIIELPNVGTAKEFDLEGCAALNPDLVILPAKLKDVIPSLEQLGITVLAVKPEDQDLLEAAVEFLGKATDSVKKADELLQYIDTKMDELEKALNGTSRPKVYMAGNSSLLSTAGPAMYQNSLMVNAGGENVAKDLTDNYWAEISYEQLLTWNPEYIVLAADADYTVESVIADPNLAECDAVVNGQVYQFPSDIESWDSPVPGSVLGNLWLASVLHPEQYPAGQYEQAAADFYETFYGFTPEKK